MEIYPESCSPKDVYKLVTGSVVPRPVALVSTFSEERGKNLAPFSFYNAVSGVPPILMFAVSNREGAKKDTLVNIENNPEFVVNVVSQSIMQQMHNCSVDFRPDVNEFEETGLTPVPAKAIRGYAVKESPIHMECRLEDIVPMGRNQLVFGRIVCFNIQDDIISPNLYIDFGKLQPIGNLVGGVGYTTNYETVKLEKQFDPTKVLDYKDHLR